MNKLRKGDTVKIISGNYKDQTGRIIKMNLKTYRVIVEGINKVKKHTRPSQENQQGGIIEKEMSIHISNVMLLVKGKPVKVGFSYSKNGKKIRINKKNNNIIG